VGSDAPVPVDVRVLAATHRDLRREVAAGRFREDLYYRLSVVRVRVPALRERREDVPVLVEHFVARAAAELGRAPPPVPPELLARLCDYAWPGNVRQLAAWATRFVLGGGADLPDEPPPAAQGAPEPLAIDVRLGGPPVELRAARATFDRAYVALVLERHGGSVSAAAKALGVNRTHLSEMLGRLGLRKA
jgi:DNA-binding NtrC family response regulator